MMTGELMVWAPIVAFALAVVTTVGYVFGRNRRRGRLEADAMWRELKEAKAAIRDLEGISKHVRQMLATHHSSVLQFKDRMTSLSEDAESTDLRSLSEEAERMLGPTMRLSTEMAQAYDEIRQQTNLLMSFTEVRTDPLTGLNNRRAMEENLKTLFAMKERYNTEFSIAIVDIDQFKRLNDEQGHLFGDKVLQQVADALNKSVRDTDSVARFGGEEFVVIMPHTDLNQSCVFAERFREQSLRHLPVTVSIGLAIAAADDSTQTLMTRADAALFSAKSTGRNCVFKHTGQTIEMVGQVTSQRPGPTRHDSDPMQIALARR